MSSLSKQEQLRALIDEEQERVRETFPAHRGSAVVALTRARDWHYLISHNVLAAASHGAAAHNSYLFASGWHLALGLCFVNGATSPSVSPVVADCACGAPSTPGTPGAWDAWADGVLLECDGLSEGEQTLALCESGLLRMQQGGQRDFYVWVASKKMPTEWREREDLAWWTNALTKSYEREMQELVVEKVSLQREIDVFAGQWRADVTVHKTTPEIDEYYLRLGRLRLKSMACHLLYPAETVIGGCTVELYGNALAVLIGWALKRLDLCRALVAQHPSYSLRDLLATPLAAAALIDALAVTLGVDGEAIRRVMEAYSLSDENVSYHCSAAGTPAPPLLHVDEQRLVWSLTGLLSEPLLFLARELKRRYSYEYHTASHVHEEVFRRDLYQLFADKRFVRSAGSVELRGAQGDLTTDVDALIFDRKTGALAVFELKSQDVLAYSRQERIRQRDYFYNAGKQVLACVQWLARNGANALLGRLDTKQVKRLKAQRTYIFVLGRYLAHFADGAEFDQRAAWGTWPQVLRLVDEAPFGADDGHPMQSLYNKLVKDTPLAPSGPVVEVEVIRIGERRVYVYADFRAFNKRVELEEGGG